MSPLLLLAASAGAVAATVAFAWALGLGRNPAPLTAARAVAEADAALYGFAARGCDLSGCGRAALVEGREGGAALVICKGDRLLVRRLDPAARLEATDDGLRIVTGEPMMAPVSLRLPREARDAWLARWRPVPAHA